jgi:oxygen-independent coproporphyrinogen-3 oxidase
MSTRFVPVGTPPGLYVHVPFCRTKCLYCDFYSVTDTGSEDAWLAALDHEASLYEGRFGPFDSLYIGGGTPTVLDEGRMGSLFHTLRRRFAFSDDCETTVEANPDDLDAGRARFLWSLGVNRLSIGIQSFDEAELAFLRRRHTARKAREALEAAAGTGFANIGIDLMYGIPGQTRRVWQATLERALSLSPAHLSCYQVTVEGETPLAAMIETGGAALPSDEESRRLFLLASRILETRGFVHYEVSNYALPGHSCRHNEKYWRHVPYLGLGPSAHSFDGSRRWWNHRSLARYCEASARRCAPVEGSETLSAEQFGLERVYLGLRTRQGINLNDLPASSPPIVRQLEEAGLLVIRGESVRPTRRGFLVADSLPALLCL